jgi:hypothetical protein
VAAPARRASAGHTVEPPDASAARRSATRRTGEEADRVRCRACPTRPHRTARGFCPVGFLNRRKPHLISPPAARNSRKWYMAGTACRAQGNLLVQLERCALLGSHRASMRPTRSPTWRATSGLSSARGTISSVTTSCSSAIRHGNDSAQACAGCRASRRDRHIPRNDRDRARESRHRGSSHVSLRQAAREVAASVLPDGDPIPRSAAARSGSCG